MRAITTLLRSADPLRDGHPPEHREVGSGDGGAAPPPPDARHVIVDTGQHYDRMMSAIFREELGVPEPDHLLEVGRAAMPSRPLA